MAVYAAHLTRTLQGTPSIFQVTAQEALGATIKPAFKKVIEYLAAVYPDKLNWSVRWYDELYLLFDLCLQYHYLKHYAASFSETFYGLLRVPISANGEFNTGQRLPDHLEKLSLVILVLVPYVRSKTEELIEKWREADEGGRLGKSRSDRARKAAIKLYCIVHMVCEGVRLVQLGRHVAGGGGGHSPGLALLGLALRPAPPRPPPRRSWGDLATSILTGNIASVAMTFPMVGGALVRAAEYGAFAVQLLRWYDAGPGGAGGLAPLPVPPPPPIVGGGGGRVNLCGVCDGPWRAPAAVPASGLVYCYGCVSRALRARPACPRSGLPATHHDLRRLYLTH